MNKTVKEVSFLSASDGNYITDNKGIPLIVETVREISEDEKKEMDKRRSVYEHILMLSIIEYFADHDEIDRATAEAVCGKGTTTTVGYLNKLINLGIIQKQKESVATVYRIGGL